ncbi:hypothetical protein TDB9533_04764 [Thalassocella blandensis]|nr:hypothetical protein TDB9533_04764 [Thalassocella blandensis]
MRNIERIGKLSIVISVLLLTAGMLTFSFKPTRAKVVSFETIALKQNGYLGGKQGAGQRGGAAMKWNSVEYEYTIRNSSYRSNFYGFKLPIYNLQKLEYGNDVTAFICPFAPGFSVLSRGPSILSIGFLLIGFGMFSLKAWLSKYTQ